MPRWTVPARDAPVESDRPIKEGVAYMAKVAANGPPRVIALDGDDTLWHSETMFSMSHGEVRNLITRHVDPDVDHIDEMLLATERRNLSAYGYGIKGFVLSMIETAIEMTEGRIPAQDIGAILKLGRAMLQYPVE